MKNITGYDANCTRDEVINQAYSMIEEIAYRGFELGSEVRGEIVVYTPWRNDQTFKLDTVEGRVHFLQTVFGWYQQYAYEKDYEWHQETFSAELLRMCDLSTLERMARVSYKDGDVKDWRTAFRYFLRLRSELS